MKRRQTANFISPIPMWWRTTEWSDRRNLSLYLVPNKLTLNTCKTSPKLISIKRNIPNRFRLVLLNFSRRAHHLSPTFFSWLDSACWLLAVTYPCRSHLSLKKCVEAHFPIIVRFRQTRPKVLVHFPANLCHGRTSEMEKFNSTKFISFLHCFANRCNKSW